MTRPSVRPTLLNGIDDSEWTYYVRSHDEDEIDQVDYRDELVWEKLWMRPANAADREEFWEEFDGPAWIVCSERDPQAEPWIGVRYKA